MLSSLGFQEASGDLAVGSVEAGQRQGSGIHCQLHLQELESSSQACYQRASQALQLAWEVSFTAS